MNKVWLIIQREFLNRVQKKSFLIATILVPLIFPAIIGGLIYMMKKEDEKAKPITIQVLDESKKITFENTNRLNFVLLDVSLEKAREIFNETNDFGLLYIPAFDLSKPEGFTLFTKEDPSLERIGDLENVIETKIHDLKLEAFNIDKETLKSLKTNINLSQKNSETGEDKSSFLLSGAGFALGILIYMFVLIYGIQIMQGVIDEKTSKIVEVIVSSVKPFQLMLGKILGIAAVGVLQFLIWIVLIGVIWTGVLGSFGYKMPQKEAMEIVQQKIDQDSEAVALKDASNQKIEGILKNISQIPWMKIAFVFVFYFLGGYLLYGALFAAVGSAVDSQQEAQQFQFPVTIPLLIGYLGLFMFILRDPHGPVSFWLSVIPFTSPVAMVGRIAFGVPAWELVLSMVLLVGGFLLTTWVAGRIYRVGILMTGTKVSYKVLAKWFMQKG